MSGFQVEDKMTKYISHIIATALNLKKIILSDIEPYQRCDAVAPLEWRSDGINLVKKQLTQGRSSPSFQIYFLISKSVIKKLPVYSLQLHSFSVLQSGNIDTRDIDAAPLFYCIYICRYDTHTCHTTSRVYKLGEL